MELINLLRTVEMFAGLTEEQMGRLAGVFEEQSLSEGEVLFHQGDPGDSLCLIKEGFVEIYVEAESGGSSKAIVNLGPGQSVGEMALIDYGNRSASVRAATGDTVVAMVTREAFENLCEKNTDIGYQVMRNIAADLSFKLRHRDLTG